MLVISHKCDEETRSAVKETGWKLPLNTVFVQKGRGQDLSLHRVSGLSPACVGCIFLLLLDLA